VVNVGKRRNNTDISVQILKIALKGARKSHIVYRANLNFEIVKKYLNKLNTSGLITHPSTTNHLFQTTLKGAEYIHQYDNLNSFINVQ
jgi:predicted transcriptional regulator